MISARFRKYFSGYFEKLGEYLPKNPYIYTISSLLFALAYVLVFLSGEFQVAFILALLAYFMDVLDGAVARISNQTSSLGAYVDAVFDRLVEIFVLFPFIYFVDAPIVFFAISGSLVVSYLKARADMELRIGNLNWPQFGERAERGIITLLAVLLMPSNTSIWLLLALVVLAWLTAFQRFFYAVKLFRHNS